MTKKTRIINKVEVEDLDKSKSFVLNTLKSYNRSKRGIFYLKYLNKSNNI